MEFISVILSNPEKPFAYLDPGSGSIFFQLLIAGLLGFGVFIRFQWKRIKSFFNREKKSRHKNPEIIDE
jgi:hypothetical protein